MIGIAGRNIKKYQVVPLLYELGKAGANQVNEKEFYHGLKRAHDFSGIGQVSNSLTKLWNKDNPDREAAALLCFYNNLVIDAAKTGFVNSYEQYPQIKRRINHATGGKNGKMPFFFQYSKNGRRFAKLPKKEKKKYGKTNDSTMNRLCAIFDNIGNINMNYANVPPFNWQMLMTKDAAYIPDAIELFCKMDDNSMYTAMADVMNSDDKYHAATTYQFVAEDIVEQLTMRYGDLNTVYPSIVKYLFAGNGATKSAHKRMFWRVFGEIAVNSIESNLETYTICTKCGMKIPSWAKSHNCPTDIAGFFECCDCGAWTERINSKQCRCATCQKEAKRIQNNIIHRLKYHREKQKNAS